MDIIFPWNLELLKEFDGSPQPCGVTTNGKSIPMVFFVISSWDLDAQQGLFKFTMKSNATKAMEKVVAMATDKV